MTRKHNTLLRRLDDLENNLPAERIPDFTASDGQSFRFVGGSRRCLVVPVPAATTAEWLERYSGLPKRKPGGPMYGTAMREAIEFRAGWADANPDSSGRGKPR
jgi:hypothetical protein